MKGSGNCQLLPDAYQVRAELMYASYVIGFCQGVVCDQQLAEKNCAWTELRNDANSKQSASLPLWHGVGLELRLYPRENGACIQCQQATQAAVAVATAAEATAACIYSLAELPSQLEPGCKTAEMAGEATGCRELYLLHFVAGLLETCPARV